MSKVLLSDISNAGATIGQVIRNGAGGLEYYTPPAGTVTSVAASGGTTGLSFTGGPITSSGTLTLGGTLGVANGGTGATDAPGARTALGLAIGSNVQAYSSVLAAYAGGDTPSAFTLGIVDAVDAAGWRTALGLVIGTNVQAFNSKLTTLAGQTWAANQISYQTSTSALATTSLTAYGRTLIGLADAAALRTNLSLGGAALLNVGTATGTVAAGDDARIIGALQTSGGVMGGFLTLNADPTSPLHAATKQYVDNVAAGFNLKNSVRMATTGNITLSGAQTIDGVVGVAGVDRVLVRAQTTQSQNGIYVMAAGAWTRATDMDTWAEVPAANVWVTEGATLADRAYVCTSDAGGTLGTTAIIWTQFGGTGAYQAASSNLNAIAGQTTGADQITYWTGSSTAAQTTLTAFGRSLIDDADATAARVTLGVVIGTDVQAYNSNLAAIAAVSPSANTLTYWTSSTAAAQTPLTVYGRSLVGAADAAATRILLALGTAAVENIGTSGVTVPLLSTANTWTLGQTFGGVTTVSVGNATPFVVSRSGGTINCSVELRLTTGSIFYGNKDGVTFAMKGNNNLGSGANWIEITSAVTTVPSLSTVSIQATGGSITNLTTLTFLDATAQGNARLALGLGDMALQNANAVNITGGDIITTSFKATGGTLTAYQGTAFDNTTASPSITGLFIDASTLSAPVIDDVGGSVNFSRRGTTRRGAAIALYHNTADGAQAGLAFYTKGSTTVASSAVSFRLLLEHGGNLRPTVDNAYSLGTAAYQWSVVYGAQGTFMNVNVLNGATTTRFRLLAAAGQVARMQFGHSSASADDRWYIDMTATAEDGVTNVGSDLTIQARNDAGGGIGTVVSFTRATREARFGGNVTSLVTSTSSLGLSTNPWAAAYVVDEVFGPSWDNSLQVPTKNALYDKISPMATTLDRMELASSYRFDTGLMPSGATFARAGDGWYRDVTGAWVIAGTNVPRFTYRWNDVAGAYVMGGLLIEDAATNAYLKSNDISDSQWIKSGGSVTSTDTFVENAVNTTHTFRQNLSITSGTTYTVSAEVEVYSPVGSAARYPTIILDAAAFGVRVLAKFNLTAGTSVVATGTATTGMVKVSATRWLIWATATASATTAAAQISMALANSSTSTSITYTGDGISGVKATNFQTEVGTRPTSRIFTNLTAVTRPADVLTLDWSTPRYKPATLNLKYTFGDLTTQTASGVSLSNGIQAFPTNLTMSTVRYVTDTT